MKEKQIVKDGGGSTELVELRKNSRPRKKATATVEPGKKQGKPAGKEIEFRIQFQSRGRERGWALGKNLKARRQRKKRSVGALDGEALVPK